MVWSSYRTQRCFCMLAIFSLLVAISVLCTIVFLTMVEVVSPVLPVLAAGIDPHHLHPVLSKPQHTSQKLTLPCDWTAQSLATVQPHHSSINNKLHCQTDSPPNPPPLQGNTPANPNPASSIPHEPARHAPNVTSCLRRIISENCDVTRMVPPLVHYVRFGRYNLSLDCFVSVVSVARFLKPCLVIFHGDVEPEGPYWAALLNLVPQIVYVYMERPRHIFGHVIKVAEHSADVARLRILINYGGVYLDTDHVVVNPLQELLDESLVVGVEVPGAKVGNGFLVARPNATFLHLWLDSYTSFKDSVWAHHSTVVPLQLARQFPLLVKVVDTFFKPGWFKAKLFYATNRSALKMDWHRQHGVHIYTRMVRRWFFEGLLPRVDRQDNTMGDIVRYVLFGDERACL